MVASTSMSPVRTGSPRLVVRLAVEDTGPGIPQDALSRVFERFYQADPSRSRGTGTSGLGLSIVRALAEAHGGRVGAENRVEGGARLWIELPVVRLT
jgi:signal transduction histidine kinase